METRMGKRRHIAGRTLERGLAHAGRPALEWEHKMGAKNSTFLPRVISWLQAKSE